MRVTLKLKPKAESRVWPGEQQVQRPRDENEHGGLGVARMGCGAMQP